MRVDAHVDAEIGEALVEAPRKLLICTAVREVDGAATPLLMGTPLAGPQPLPVAIAHNGQ